MPYRNSPHHEIEILIGPKYLNLFKPIEHTEDYYNRGPIDKKFLFEIDDKKYNYVGKKVKKFQTDDQIVKYFSEIGYNDAKFALSYSVENIYFMLHRKYIPIQEYKTSTEKK